MFIFLDFDGVLRRLTSPPYKFDADCLDFFEKCVRPHDVKVIISSTWRLAYSLQKMKKLFVTDIAEKIIGVTPESPGLDENYRHKEVLLYLKNNGLIGKKWIAVDDDPLHYPENAPVILTNPGKGFEHQCAIKLENWIKFNIARGQSKITCWIL